MKPVYRTNCCRCGTGWVPSSPTCSIFEPLAYQIEFVMESLEVLSLAVSAVLLHREVLVGVVCAEIFKREVIPQCTQGVVLVHE